MCAFDASGCIVGTSSQTCANGCTGSHPNAACCTPVCSGKCGGPDGCGGSCPDNCVAPQTCGGGGTASACGTPPCVLQVSAGGYHTCAVKQDGTLWCWGRNDYGQTGDGTMTASRPSPVQVMALGTTVVEVAAGGYHTCARKKDGTLWCWGRNEHGQIGDGTTAVAKPSPVQLTALGTSVVGVAAGSNRACARKMDGTLWCWGQNEQGEVGDGTTASPKPSPVQVTSLGTRIIDVVLGLNHTCARTTDGALWCWGGGGFGQIGDGTTDGPKLSPVQITTLGTSVVRMAAGDYHTCAGKLDGSLWCWGDNTFREIGDGTAMTPKPSPVEVTALQTSIDLAAGDFHTCAIKSNGSLWCWGINDFGQVGDGTTASPKPSPVQVTAVGANVIEIATGGRHSCARTADGMVWCWGWNRDGQIGDGTVVTPKPSPVTVQLMCP